MVAWDNTCLKYELSMSSSKYSGVSWPNRADSVLGTLSSTIGSNQTPQEEFCDACIVSALAGILNFSIKAGETLLTTCHWDDHIDTTLKEKRCKPPGIRWSLELLGGTYHIHQYIRPQNILTQFIPIAIQSQTYTIKTYEHTYNQSTPTWVCLPR